MRTLYVAELYGAFLDSKGQISEYDLDVIKRLQENGLIFHVATDRSMCTLSDDCNHSSDTFGYLFDSVRPKPFNRYGQYGHFGGVMLNGAYVCDAGKCPISMVTQYAVAEVFDNYGIKGEVHGIWGDRGIPRCYTNYPVSGKNILNALDFGTMRDCVDYREKEAAVRGGMIDTVLAFSATGTYEELLPLKKAAAEHEDVHFTFYENSTTGKYRMCIFPKTASQGNAIRKMKEELVCDRVVCISDSMYDLSMFEAADVKVAMGNADEATKTVADMIIDTNDRSGLVKFLLEEYINNDNLYPRKDIK